MGRIGLLFVVCALVSACTSVDGADGEAGESGTQGTAGTAGPAGPAGPAGSNGAEGAPGADGQLRIYGDGSTGALVVSADAHWGTTPPGNGTYQFTDLTIEAGATLRVNSGTILRCSGTFTNKGALVVGLGALAGQMQQNGSTFLFSPPGLGNATAAPTPGQAAPAGAVALGGRGGIGMLDNRAWNLLQPGLFGGGGAGHGSGVSGYAGGSLVVLARGAIANEAGATIEAKALEIGNSGGGGGGGIVILASKTSIAQAGTVDVSGGSGKTGAATTLAPGGGGGGGLVRLLAPTITNTGTANIAGGAAATTPTGPFNAATRIAGGGGGACVGNGGSGATIDADGSIKTAAQPGGAGVVIESKVDPTALF